MARVWITLLIPAEPPVTLSTFMNTININDILAIAETFHNNQSGDKWLIRVSMWLNGLELLGMAN